MIKKIILLFLLPLSYVKGQENITSVNGNKFYERHKLEFVVSNIKYKIFEAINKETNERFIVINENSKSFINKKSLLNPEFVEGYATNFIKRTKQGFYYSFEFGNRHHYEYEFYFKLIKRNFFLYKVKRCYSDLANPSNLKVKTIPVKNKKFTLYNINAYVNQYE